MPDHSTVNLRDKRNCQRTGIAQCTDDELLCMVTNIKCLEGSDRDLSYGLNVCGCFVSDNHFAVSCIRSIRLSDEFSGWER